MSKRFTFYTSIFCTGLLLLCYWIVVCIKIVPSGDETISYLCATGNQQHYEQIHSQQEVYGKEADISSLQHYFTRQPGSFKNIAADLTKTDLHPPLYFWLLRLFTYLPVSLFTSGLILNFVLHLLSFLVLVKLMKHLALSPVAQLFVLAGWCISPAIAGVGFYARQYELLGLMNLLGIYFFMLYHKERKPLYLSLLFLCLMAGMFTQYLFIYFSFAYAGFALIIERDKKLTIILLAVIASALLLIWFIHPGIVQQFATQQSRTQEFTGISGIVTRTGKIILSFIQVLVPVLAMKTFFMALPGVVAGTAAIIILTIIGVAGFKYRNKLVFNTGKPFSYFMLWMLFCSVGLSIVPYLLFLTPLHAMGGQYLTLVYPFLLIILAVIVSQHVKLLFAALSLMFVGLAVQMIVLFNQQQQDKMLVSELERSDLLVVNTVNRRGFLRLVPLLSHPKVMLDEQALPCNYTGRNILFIAEESTIPENACDGKTTSYDLRDGVVMYTIKPSFYAPSLSK